MTDEMTDGLFERLEAVIACDVNGRGLAADPAENLVSVCRGDLGRACHSLAAAAGRPVGIVTGFFIPSAAAPETDGPPGAVLLAEALARLGSPVTLLAEGWCAGALRVAVELSDLADRVEVTELGPRLRPRELRVESWSHLVAIERPGPSHTPESVRAQRRTGAPPVAEFLREVPPEEWDQCHTMRGRRISDVMWPAHVLFERPGRPATVGIGDGGNEIGMGKVPWEVVARNVPGGGRVACRVAADYNIVCGLSNWGGYALAAGVWRLSGRAVEADLFSPARHRAVWQEVLRRELLVDGMTGERTLAVDGLPWDAATEPLSAVARALDP